MERRTASLLVLVVVLLTGFGIAISQRAERPGAPTTSGPFTAPVPATPAPTTGKAIPSPAPKPVVKPDAARDIRVVRSTCEKGGFGGVAIWNITLTNTSKTFTYRDLMYRTMYEGESGARLHTKRGVLTIVIRPGETKRISKYNDGFISQQVARCGFVLYGAAS